MGAGAVGLLSTDGRRSRRCRPRRGKSARGCGSRHLVDRGISPLTRGRLPRAHRRGRGGEAAMSFSWTRVGAILQKELRDYRRNRFVVLTMAFLPLIFITAPMVQLFTIKASITSAKFDAHIGLALLYMLILPAIIPSVLSAYSVVGEREQGTLEPILTTPIHSEEFLIGKALAALLPTLAVAYVIFGVFLGAVAAFAHRAVASAIFERDHLLVQ